MNHPPSILERLRQSAAEASPAVRKVGLWMAAHPLRAISLSADEIAEQAQASQAAVNRFATHAGFEGLAQLRAALTAELQDVREPVAKLQRLAGMPDEHPFASAQEGLLHAAQSLDVALLDQCAQAVLAARHVFVLGLGMSHFAAGFAASALMPYVQGSTHVSDGGGSEQIVRRMMKLGPNDVLIAISVPRYSMDTVALATAARDRGTHVVAITDQLSSPLAAVAQTVLLAPAQHGVLSHSYVSIMALIEALISTVVRLHPGAAAIAADMYDTLLPHLMQSRKR